MKMWDELLAFLAFAKLLIDFWGITINTVVYAASKWIPSRYSFSIYFIHKAHFYLIAAAALLYKGAAFTAIRACYI